MSDTPELTIFTVVEGIHQAGLLSEVAPRRCCFYLLPLQKAHSGFGRSIFAILTLLWGLIDSLNPTLIGLTVSAHVCLWGNGATAVAGGTLITWNAKELSVFLLVLFKGPPTHWKPCQKQLDASKVVIQRYRRSIPLISRN